MMRWHLSANGHESLNSFNASTQFKRLDCACIVVELEYAMDEEALEDGSFSMKARERHVKCDTLVQESCGHSEVDNAF